MKIIDMVKNKCIKSKIKSMVYIILFICVFFFGVGILNVNAKENDTNDYFEDVIFEGSDEEQIELERLLMSKLTYSYLDGYEGKTVDEYVYDNPEEYSGEIWKNSGITYDMLYSSIIGDWEIYAVYNKNSDSGFYAVAYRKADEVVYTFRGSEMFTEEFALDDSNDWTGTDYKFAVLNKLSGQFDDADECLKVLRKRLNNDKIKANITLTGHSLGGALVTYESLVSGLQGYSFDGAAGHVIDLVYYYNYLDIKFEGIQQQPFVNYTDVTGYPVADLIQHTNSSCMYQIDRETTLKDLEEYTLIPKYSTAGSHIAWSTVEHDGNVIKLTDMQDEDGDGYTYSPDSYLCLDIKKNIIEAVSDKITCFDFDIDLESLAGSMTGVVKDGRVMLASENGSELRAYDGIGVSGAFEVSAVLYGGAGDDALYGYTANDVLIPGMGNDIVDGGMGDDVYIIDKNPDGNLLIRDTYSVHSSIILRGFDYLDDKDIEISDKELSASDQAISLELSPGQVVDIYCYYRDNIKKVMSYTVSGNTKSEDSYVVFLEGKGSLTIYEEDIPVWSINDYEDLSESDYETEYGKVYICEEEGKESILLILDEEKDVRVSNYDKRVNLALARYNNIDGIYSTERKYKRRFDEYKIYFSDAMLDDGGAGDTSWEDVFDAGMSFLLK